MNHIVAAIDPAVSTALTDSLGDAFSQGKTVALILVPAAVGAVLFGKAVRIVPQYVGRLFSKAKG